MTSKMGEMNMVYIILEGQVVLWGQDKWQEGTCCFEGESCGIGNINWTGNKENRNYLADLETGSRACPCNVSLPTRRVIWGSLPSISLALESQTKPRRIFGGELFFLSFVDGIPLHKRYLNIPWGGNLAVLIGECPSHFMRR